VTLAGWLMGINGAFAALGGVVLLLVASNAREMQRHGLAQGPSVAFGFVLLTVGLLELLLVDALFGEATSRGSSRRWSSDSRSSPASSRSSSAGAERSSRGSRARST
jgi:hypothetical protein